MIDRNWLADHIRSKGSLRLPSVRPILEPDQHGDPSLAGSAVLVWFRGERFLISAAHVLDRGDAVLCVGTVDSWIELPQPYHFTRLPPSGDREDDLIDIGFVHLPAPVADSLAGCLFLRANEIDERDSPEKGVADRSLYVALGWPQNKMRMNWRERTTTPDNLGYVGMPVPVERYTQVGFDPNTHLLIEFDPQESISSSGVGKPPKLHGLSGGGVWRVSSPVTMDIGGDRLVGLTIQVEREDRLLVATRIGVVLRAIMQYHFEVSPDG